MATFTTPKSRKSRNCPPKAKPPTPPTPNSAYDLELATYHRHLQVQTANALMGQFYNGGGISSSPGVLVKQIRLEFISNNEAIYKCLFENSH